MLLSEGLRKVLVNFALSSGKLETLLHVGTAEHGLKESRAVWAKMLQV